MERRVINSHVESEIHSRLSLIKIAEKISISQLIADAMKKVIKTHNHSDLLQKVRERCIAEFSMLSVDDKKLTWGNYKEIKTYEMLDKGICVSDINEIFNFEYETRK